MPDHDRRESEYHAFLLRLWRDHAQQSWRASLQSTTTGERFHFGTLDELFAYLDARLETGDSEGRQTLQMP
jgi:hypothetical protein